MTAPKTYATAGAFRRALEDRLSAMALKESLDIQRLRREVAFDRLLARLFQEEAPPWVLKGGYAMELRIKQARATKDMDFSLRRTLSRESLWELLRSAAGRGMADFFVFRVGPPMRDIEGAPEGGARHPVEALVDGRTFTRFHLDVGGGDALMEPLEIAEGKDWLKFAGVPAPRVSMVPREQQFADKLHAMTRPRQTPNSRVRDIVDMVLLIRDGRLERGRTARAIRTVFVGRKTHPLPSAILPPPPEWKTPYDALAGECGLREGLEEAFQRVAEYFSGLPLDRG